MESFKGEKIKKETSTQKIYFYYDTENKIDQKSKIEYKKKDLIVHFPRGFEGGDKYKTIKQFSFVGFKGKLPVGIVKSVNYGYGFTKKLNRFAFYINDNFTFKEVIVEKQGKTELDTTNKILYLSEISLQKLHDSFDVIFKKNNAEISSVLDTVLFELFPAKIEKPKATYISNTIATSLSNWGHSIEEFSKSDKRAILDLFDKLSLTNDFLSVESLAKTKEIVDSKYIQGVLKKYRELMILVTDGDSLEKRWQEFLKTDSWIFSSIFAQPVILYKDEAYVGGKNIDNKNGKFNDFLIKNSLSDNVSFLEIKTHKTKLLENNAYRGEDVYSATKDLTGCIAQVLNQRDNFQKEFYQTKVKSKGGFETFNSKCVVLIGSIKDLNDNQKYSFELFRSNSRDVEIITFDELQTKIESLQTLMKK
ncbi:MAG: DUF4263 domain-containing protein [Flavobacteriaceae bacterium]|nr:DUF4263 domain-containing protein [Flavobacteriaceae bacterium]